MKKKVMLNVGCTMLCQLVTFISGLIVPRLILSTFGSEANGLVSSITQFLNYIALVIESGRELLQTDCIYICVLHHRIGMCVSDCYQIELFVALCGFVDCDFVTYFVYTILFFYYVQAFAAGGSENVYRSTLARIDYIVEHHCRCCFGQDISRAAFCETVQCDVVCNTARGLQ